MSITLMSPAVYRPAGVVALVMALMLSLAAKGAGAAEIAVAPDDDLTRAADAAADGDTLVLAAGRHTGALRIVGKTLTVRGPGQGVAVLAAPKGSPIAQVGKGGRLYLGAVELAPTSDPRVPALFVDEGALALRDCRAAGHVAAVVYVQAGQAELDGCRFEGTAGPAVVGRAGATVALRQTTFADLKGSAVVVQDSSLEVQGGRLERIAQAGIQASGGSLRVSRTAFGANRAFAVQLSQGVSARIADVDVTGPGRAGIAQFDGGTLHVQQARFDGLDGAGVLVQDGGTARVDGSTFAGAGIAVLGGTARLDAEDNVISALKDGDAAIVFQADGRLRVVGNTSDGPLLNLKGSLEEPARIEDNRALTRTGQAVLLAGAAQASLRDNVLLSAGETGVFVDGEARLDSAGNVIAGDKAAVYVANPGSAPRTIDDDVLIGGVRPQDAAQRGSAGLRLETRLRDGDAADRLRALAGAVLDAAATERPGQLDALLRAVADLRQSANRLATLRFQAVDVLGTPFSPPFRVTPAADPAAEPTAGAAGEALALAPGAYRVSSAASGEAGQVSLGEGDARTLQAEAPGHLVLQFPVGYREGKPVSARRAIALRPARARRAALDAYRWMNSAAWQWLNADLAVRRSGVDADTARSALAEARAALAAATDARAGAKDAEAAGLDALASTATRILVALGEDGADVDAILAYADAPVAEGRRLHLHVAAAWLERRLGRLTEGRVVGRLSAADKPTRTIAGAALAFVGARARAEETLIASLSDPQDHSPTLAGVAMAALVGSDDPRTTAIARTLVDLRLRAQEHGDYDDPRQAGGMAAAIHLLGHGTAADWAPVAALVVSPAVDEPLSLLAADPVPLALTTIERLGGYTRKQWDRAEVFAMREATRLCPTLRALGRQREAQATGEVLDAWIRTYRQQNPKSSDVAFFAHWYYRLARSDCRADAMAARAMNQPNRVSTWPFPWMPDLDKGDRWGFLPLAEVEQRAAEAFPDDARRRRLAVHLRRVATVLPFQTVDYVPRGVDRQAVVLRHTDSPTGAVSVVAGLRAEFVDGSLILGLTLDVAGHKRGALADVIADDKRGYTVFRETEGRALLSAVSLRRNGTPMALEPAGRDGRGAFTFRAAPEVTDLAGLHVDVELDVYGSRHTLSYPLFAGELARTRPGDLRRLAAAREAFAADPGSPRVVLRLADALGDAGQWSEALPLYERLLDSSSGKPRARLAIARLYAARGLDDPARRLLEQGVRATPDASFLWVELARLRFKAGDYAAAAQAYGQLAQAAPEASDWPWWQALSQMLAGDEDAAWAYFSTAGAGQPELELSMQLHYLLAVRGQGRDPDAAVQRMMRVFSQGVVNRPGRPDPQAARMSLFAPSGTKPKPPPPVVNSPSACRWHLALAIRALDPDEPVDARSHFETAARICPPDMAHAHVARHGAAMTNGGPRP